MKRVRRWVAACVAALAITAPGALPAAQGLSDDGGAVAAGQDAFGKRDYATAIRIWQKVLPALEKSKDGRAGYVQASIGEAYYELKDTARALEALRAAAGIDQRLANPFDEAQVWGNIGLIETQLYLFDAALTANRRALALALDVQNSTPAGNDLTSVRSLELNDLNNLGNDYSALGRFDTAAAEFAAALAIVEVQPGDHRLEEVQELINAGLVEQRVGKYDEALASFDRALTLARAIPEPYAQAGVLENMGLVEENLGRFDDALGAERQALELYRGPPPAGAHLAVDPLRGQVQTLGNIGALQTVLGHPADALVSLQSALPLATGDTLGRADLLAGIGVARSRLGFHPDALALFRQSLELERSVGNALDESADLDLIADEQFVLGSNAEARQSAGQALALDQRLGTPGHRVFSLQLVAKADARLGRRDAALAEYAAAVDGIEGLRASIAGNERGTFFNNLTSVYDEYIAYLLELERRFPGKGYARKAIEIFERKSARSSLEQIGRTAALHYRGVDAATLAAERSADSEAEAVQSLLTTLRTTPGASAAALAAAQRNVEGARARLHALESRIRVRFPQYYALRHPQTITLAGFQRTVLRPGELVLEYALLDGGSALWSIDRDRVELVPLPGGREIAAEIARLRVHVAAMLCADSKGTRLDRIAAADLPGFAADSYALYRALVPEAVRARLAHARSVIVVPSGALYDVPFETLVTRDPAGSERPHYLLEDAAISYVPSSSLLSVVRAAYGRPPAGRTPLLALANPAYGSTDAATPGLSPYAELQIRAARAGMTRSAESCSNAQGSLDDFFALPGTQVEAEAVRSDLGAPASSLVSGEDATRARVLALDASGELKRVRYLLFATHAVLPGSIQGVTQPSIVLAHPESGDGLLTMADVLGLSLDADFVALSACNTGVETADAGGEGISGFTRAFLYAGTPAISVTLWEVSDDAAPLITPQFFTGMATAKLSPAEALRRAKLAMLESPDAHLRHPYAWGPSVIFGDGATSR